MSIVSPEAESPPWSTVIATGAPGVSLDLSLSERSVMAHLAQESEVFELNVVLTQVKILQ